MQTHATASKPAARRQRPKTLTVFAAAFAAGAVLAYGVDRMVDVHVVRVLPQVESEPIFVALRSLPQGSPVTVWDVALKDWPKAMLPTTALRADASFEGMVLRHPVREGQPLLSVQLVRDGGILPGATVAALPPADPRSQMGTAALRETFVPATPAEPPATTGSETARQPAGRAVEPAPATPRATEPATDPGAVATVVPAPAAEVAPPAEPAATDRTARDDAPAIVAVVQPRSTDVDETIAPPADAPAAPTPVVTDVVAAEPVAVQTPWPTPSPASTPKPPAGAADMGAIPLGAPVPALPSTDIERSLARFGHAHAAPVHAPATPAAQRATPAEQTASVLDRTTEAEQPVANQSAPRLHLVVPERIALAADASFAQPKPLPAAQPQPGPQPQPSSQPQSNARTAESGRGPAATTPQGRAAARKPTAANPATRKQPGPRPAAAKAQPSQNRGENAWLPTFLGGSRQR